MYERFTDRARKVMQLANHEAHRLRHAHIGTEHLVFGLLHEGHGVAANVLRNLGVDVAKLRAEVERVIPPGTAPADLDGRLPHTPRAKFALDAATAAAEELGHNYVGTEHLLLGVARDEDGVGAQALARLGIGPQQLRDEVLNLLGVAPTRKPSAPPGDFQVVATITLADPLPDPFRGLDTVIDRLRDIRAEAIAAARFVEAAWFHDQIKTLEQVRDAVAARLGSY